MPPEEQPKTPTSRRKQAFKPPTKKFVSKSFDDYNETNYMDDDSDEFNEDNFIGDLGTNNQIEEDELMDDEEIEEGQVLPASHPLKSKQKRPYE